MKKLLLTLLMSVGMLTAQAQTTSWYGYPAERQASALAGGVTAALSYSIARSVMENEPKWHSAGVSIAATTLTSIIAYAVKGEYSMIERRQNFTACFLSGVTVTLIFSLGI